MMARRTIRDDVAVSLAEQGIHPPPARAEWRQHARAALDQTIDVSWLVEALIAEHDRTVDALRALQDEDAP